MLSQAQDFREESVALHELLDARDAATMAIETQFKGWTIDAVIQHLHFFNHAVGLSLTDEAALTALFAELKAGRDRGASLVQWTDRWLDGLRGRALLDAWRETFHQVADLFLEADPKRRLKWAGPEMSARSSITARLMETWAHGQEVYDILGARREEHDRVRNIVVLGVNTYEWTFKNRGEPVPGPRPYLNLTAPSGAVWRYGEPSQAEAIVGEAVEFCQVVCQTRNVADTGLQVTGKAAGLWMKHAQCFAGAPNDPPAPGTRYRKSLLG